MRILIVGVFAPYDPFSDNIGHLQGFKEAGHEADSYCYRQNAIKYDGSYTHLNPKRDEHLYNYIMKTEPQVIVWSKVNDVPISIIIQVKAQLPKTKHVLFYMDPANGNLCQSLIQKMKFSDLVVCTRYAGIDVGLKYNKNTVKIYDGADKTLFYPMDLPKKYDVSFIGELRGERREFLKGIPFHTFTGQYGEAHSEIVSQSKINLNFTEKDGISHRAYTKIPYSKGFLLTQNYRGIEDDFIIGKHIDIFETVEDLKEKITYYLEHDEEREQIASNLYEYVMKNYTNKKWAEKIVNILLKI